MSGCEHYVTDPFTDPNLVAKRGFEALGCIGTPEKVNETIKELESQRVSHVLGYMDAGGLCYDEIEGTLHLFAEKVMPNFR